LGWSQHKFVLRIIKRCKIKFSIDFDYVDEVECDVIPPNACEVMFGNPYLWHGDVAFYREENKYFLVKGGNLIKELKGIRKISMIETKQKKKNTLILEECNIHT